MATHFPFTPKNLASAGDGNFQLVLHTAKQHSFFQIGTLLASFMAKPPGGNKSAIPF
ncbi:hypothetical protein [uncultured Mailhella sp.]|uniref:hypothetical protein n=1 Tax=uncultured Mailhella sp. TaxID=1981031 RepID=UPI0026012D97|nr:hypothetical protein [uncultured Mailhella sp.]